VSLSNGEVRLGVTVFDQPGGNRLGETSTIELNVHAGWETAGTVIFGAFVVIIFVLGIVRTVRKRRRAARNPE
jgi:glucose uptake protein GlcU